MTRRQAARGFTLIEALVAVTLLALLAGSFMPLFQQGLALLERGDRRTRAVMLAQSLLEEHAVAKPLDGEPVESDAAGSEGGFSWRVVREPYDTATDGGPLPESEAPGIVLARVSASVAWEGGAGGVRLSTLVMERAP